MTTSEYRLIMWLAVILIALALAVLVSAATSTA